MITYHKLGYQSGLFLLQANCRFFHGRLVTFRLPKGKRRRKWRENEETRKRQERDKKKRAEKETRQELKKKREERDLAVGGLVWTRMCARIQTNKSRLCRCPWAVAPKVRTGWITYADVAPSSTEKGIVSRRCSCIYSGPHPDSPAVWRCGSFK